MEKSQTGTITGGRLNLREKPSVQSRRLILIPDGTQIAVSEYDAQWYKAQYKAYDGYVMKHLCSFSLLCLTHGHTARQH